MSILYGLLTLLLLSALTLIAIPFVKNRVSILSTRFLAISAFIILFSFTLYLTLGQTKELQQWFSYGKNHYQLSIEVDRLGGIDGIIARLLKKLEANPNDAKGWFILGKLYFAKQDYTAAVDAFGNARYLQPQNQEINQYFEMAKAL